MLSDKDKALTTALAEMIEYFEQNSLSYYEIATIAYNKDKEDWIKVLESKKYRQCLVFCIRDCKRDKRIKYRKTMQDALSDYLDAQIAYNKRHEETIGKE